MDVRTGFFALLILGLGVVGYLLVEPFLQYVLGAGLLAFMLRPVHLRLAASVGPRISAALLTLLVLLVAIVPLIVLSVIVLATAAEFVDQLERGDVETVQESLRSLFVDRFGVSTERMEQVEGALESGIEDAAYTASETVLSEFVSIINTTIHTSFGFMTLLFLLYYFLLDGERFLDWVRHVAPLHDAVQDELLSEIASVTWAVIFSHLLVAIVVGVLGGVGFAVAGLPNVAFWTVVMIVVTILPVIGVWLVWGPAVVYLLSVGAVVPALVLLVYGLAILSLIDNYLRAIFVDQGSGLHPAVVLVGVLGGIYLLGILGLFLGPVLLAVFKVSLAVFSENWHQLGPEEPQATPQRAE
ncbi:AI-2E family transporter [Halovivax cerinus]|uniref:AI-2E family transporter n=1 Tax=Halovivax cerinus TaxID=1487865 RepID=A0ABD5NM11_9EURY|nr:AI-2E family transporter [Halovivax cerinus]